jgi:aquaporin Z
MPHMSNRIPNLAARLAAELTGTFWLVLGGCGSAVLAAAGPAHGSSTVGVALAFGLALVTMGYALGPVSGCHLNPAVSLALTVAGRLAPRELLSYVMAQVLGAVLGALALYLIASGSTQLDLLQGGFATNGYGEHSPGHFTLAACFLCEALLTGGFVLVILGAGSARAPRGFAPLAAGLALTLAHLVAIPVTGTSVNPARSTGVALFASGEALQQLWLFWVAPVLGALVAALGYRALFARAGARLPT